MAIQVLSRLRAAMPESTLVMAGQDKGVEAEVRQLAKEYVSMALYASLDS